MLFKIFVALSLSVLSTVRGVPGPNGDYLVDDKKNGTCSSEYCMIMNSTTCQEFLRGTEFDPNSVLDVDWKIFYFWNYLMLDSYQIRFSVPSTMLVERYKLLLGDEIPGTAWKDAQLFLETGRGFSGLLIRTNSSGLYRLLSVEMYDALLNVPPMLVALKVVEGYLGFYLNCEKRVCFALAPVDRMPQDDQLTAAAAKLHFHSQLGRSYLTSSQREDRPQDPLGEEDDQDEEWYLRNTAD